MDKNEESTLTVIGAFLVIAIAVLIIGTMESRDAEMDQQAYCEMVKEGKWPDYEGTYHEFCERGDD